MGPDRRVVGLRDRKRKKAEAHHGQIAERSLHRRFDRSPASIFVQIQTDQGLPMAHKNVDPRRSQEKRHQDLQPEGMADPLLIIFAAVLCSKNTDPGKPAEYTQIPDK